MEMFVPEGLLPSDSLLERRKSAATTCDVIENRAIGINELTGKCCSKKRIDKLIENKIKLNLRLHQYSK